MKSQTPAWATGVVSAGEEGLSEDPNQGHRPPGDRTVCFVRTAGSMGGPGGPVNLFSAAYGRASGVPSWWRYALRDRPLDRQGAAWPCSLRWTGSRSLGLGAHRVGSVSLGSGNSPSSSIRASTAAYLPSSTSTWPPRVMVK